MIDKKIQITVAASLAVLAFTQVVQLFQQESVYQIGPSSDRAASHLILNTRTGEVKACGVSIQENMQVTCVDVSQHNANHVEPKNKPFF